MIAFAGACPWLLLILALEPVYAQRDNARTGSWTCDETSIRSGIVPLAPVLPGIDRFQALACGAVRILAEEADDPAWARPMEDLLAGEFERLIDIPIGESQVSCRSTICGVLFTYSDQLIEDGNPFPASPNLGSLAESLAARASLDRITTYHSLISVDGFRFVVIYLSKPEIPG